jgi:DNA-binding beta-propeller fold protein YncE
LPPVTSPGHPHRQGTFPRSSWRRSPRDRLAEHAPGIAGFARLARIEPSGDWRYIADLGAYEEANNPDGRLHEDGSPFYDSNPYGALALPGGPVVTDAGGNSLLRVGANGDVSLLAVFQSRGSTPPRPSFAPPPFDQFTDAVPTSVVVGPDGAYYVSELTGVPFVDRRANIYRVVPGEPARLHLTGDACLGGFKMVIDLAFDEQGNLYVLQFATGALQQTGPGILVRIRPDTSAPSDICARYRAGTRTVVLGGPGQLQLSQPASVAVGPDGALYVSNHGVSAGGGEVLRIEP